MLSLNGELIKLSSARVEMSMELKDQDMSGQSSGTDSAEQGDKGKKLSITGQIPFNDSAMLTRLYQLASAKDEYQNRLIYRVANSTAQALKIRQAKFTGRINASEHGSLLAWNISFELREHNSVAEQKEQRQAQQVKSNQVQDTRHQAALKAAEEVGI